MDDNENTEHQLKRPARVRKETVATTRKALVSDAPAERNAFLEVFRLATGNVRVKLKEEDVIIGRDSECAIDLPYDDISRNHARIFLKNDQYYLEDLNSMNGTYLNDIKVERAVLRSNDIIGVGPISITFYEDEVRSLSG